MWEAGREGKGIKGPLAGATESPSIQLSPSRFKSTSHPGCRSGGLGMGLLKPSLPTSQYVSSAPLPWENTKERDLRQIRVRDGESLGLGETGRPYICRHPYKATECGPRTFSSVRPRHSIWKPWSRAQRIRTVLMFTWMR